MNETTRVRTTRPDLTDVGRVVLTNLPRRADHWYVRFGEGPGAEHYLVHGDDLIEVVER